MADSKPGAYKRLDSFNPLRDVETLQDDEET